MDGLVAQVLRGRQVVVDHLADHLVERVSIYPPEESIEVR